MSSKTKIEWCDSTVNPTMGCDGCELWSAQRKTCYAGILHERYGGKNKGFSPTFNVLTIYPGRMAEAARWSDLAGKDRTDKPWLNGRPRHIFVSDMSDALSKAITFDYLKSEIIDNVTSEKGRRHIWMWLTKQAGRMADFSTWLRSQGIAWPENLWPGTSVTSRATLPRIAQLLRVGDQNTMPFVSAEPLCEGVDVSHHLERTVYCGECHGSGFRNATADGCLSCCGSGIDHVRAIRLFVVGGESGPGARPCNVEWIREIIAQCKAAGVACFVKQLGRHVHQDTPGGQRQSWFPNDNKGGDWSEWAEDLRIREFPAPRPEAAYSEAR